MLESPLQSSENRDAKYEELSVNVDTDDKS